MFTSLVTIIIVLLGCLIASFVVFGGGQMFIPYFKILLVNILNVHQDVWDSALSIANATPGVFGLKLALISGYLAANGSWWGFLLMIITYFIFIAVPIIMILVVLKKYNEKKESKIIVIFSKMMRPIIAGILISLIINLGISLVLPFIGFNDLGTEFGQLDKYFYFKIGGFFIGWRYFALLAWTLVSIPVEYWIFKKYKVNVVYMITTNIGLCMLIFQPWLA